MAPGPNSDCPFQHAGITVIIQPAPSVRGPTCPLVISVLRPIMYPVASLWYIHAPPGVCCQ